MLCLTLFQFASFCTINNILPFENGVFKRQPSLWDLQSYLTYGLQQACKKYKKYPALWHGVFKRQPNLWDLQSFITYVCMQQVRKIMGIKNILPFENGVFKRHQCLGFTVFYITYGLQLGSRTTNMSLSH